MAEEALKRIYHDPSDPGSLGGVDRLLRRAKQLNVPGVDRQVVQEFLRGQQAYTLHRPARRRYKRNHTYVAGIDAQWQADLADMQDLARQNGGQRYMLTVIDVFSKFAWVAPVKSKDAETISAAFIQVLKDSAPRVPKRLQTDKGKEFFNSSFAALLKRHGISHFASESDQKAAVVERFNRTIKTRLWTYMSDKGTVRWLDALQDIVSSYNHSRHRTIGMAPADVHKKDETRLWARMYGDGDTEMKRATAVLAPGTMVRISKQKGVFEKGYLPNWSKEHFTVSEAAAGRKGSRLRSSGHVARRVYKIRDYNDEDVKGAFYPEELQHITDNQYRIERVIRKRKAADGSIELFVKWEGWPEKFNSWIREEDRYNVAGR